MSASTPIRFRLFYVDDSGSNQSGIVVYSFSEPRRSPKSGGRACHCRDSPAPRSIDRSSRCEYVATATAAVAM
jgi:hypothetical protein